MMAKKTCPTCSQPTRGDVEGLVQARIASRPDSGPAQARHIGELERLKEQVAMSTAVKCPVCNGSGKTYEPPPKDITSVQGTTRTCHGCDGRGWVTVP